MTDMIRVEPSQGRRQPFAQWAVSQNPKVDTVGPNAFAVPASLFADAPEDILIGALVDGHRYVSPDEDAVLGRPAPGELLGVATPEGLAGETDPDERDDYPPGVTTLVGESGPETVVPLASDSDDRSDNDRSYPPSRKAGRYPCGLCDRSFSSERGRAAHRRQVHKG
ncbi:hypothetical protein [Streptomyces sp. DH12]|uniref:hypothetical protein n=1 Tax=Streptomyces sp. DH12 TaxID=2857010 RepID=UPI001E5E7DD0|nr:hypothetical protein [Streptomyces sp. DH12]